MVIWTTLHQPVLQCLLGHPSPLPAALLNIPHGCVSFCSRSLYTPMDFYPHHCPDILIVPLSSFSQYLHHPIILVIPSSSSSHHPRHPIILVILSSSSSCHPHHPVILIILSSSSSCHPHLSSPPLVPTCHPPFIMSHLSSHLILGLSHLFTPLDLPIISFSYQ